MLRSAVHSIFLAVALLTLTLSPAAGETSTSAATDPTLALDETIARVGDTPPITRSELDAAMKSRVVETFGSRNMSIARGTVLTELIKERLAEELVSDDVIAAAPDLARALDESRRQVLLKYYLYKHVSVAPPTLEHIKDYIAQHSELFENRRTYHFTEIIIYLPQKTGLSALIGKVEDVTRVDNPTTESLRMFCDWLDEMRITYGYSKLWQSSEQMPPQQRKLLEALDRSDRKVRLETTGDEYRVVVLHGSFADPLDPYRSRNAVGQMLAQQAWTTAANELMLTEMSKADITIYGDPIPGLDLPRRSTPERITPSQEVLPRVALAGSIAAIIMGLSALLYFLLEPRPEMMSYQRHFMLRRMWWSLPVRLMLSLLFAGLIAAPLPTLLAGGITHEMMVPAAAGGLLAAVMILLFWLIPALRGVRELRWLAPTILGVAQAALLVALSLTRA